MSAPPGPTREAGRLGAPGMAERVLAGVAAMSLVAIVSYVGQLVVVPIGIHAWGPTRYGEWVSLSALVAFLGMTDLGVQSHVVNRMCAHYARGEHERFLHALHSALRFQVPLSLGIWLVAGVGFAFLPLDHWLSVTTASRFETYATIMLLGAELLVGVPLGAVRGTHRATGQISRAAVFTAVKRAVEFIMPASLILAGASFPVIALVRVAFIVTYDIAVIRDLYRQNSWFRLFPLGGERAEGLRMLAPGVLFFLAGVGEYLGNQGNLLVVQSFLGGEEVTHFATHRNIANMGRMLSMQVTSVVWPELTALSALSDAARLVRAHRTVSKLVGFVVGAALIGFMPLAAPVYSAWTMHKLVLDPVTLFLLVSQMTLWGFWGVATTALFATNRQGHVVVLMAVNSALSIGLSYLLVPRIGMRGAALANLAADLACASWAVPRAACAALGDQFAGYAREILMVLGLGLLVPASLSGLLYWVLPAGLLRVLLVPPVFGVLAISLFWIALASEERDAARRIGQKIRHRVFGAGGVSA